jgi:hypothetical protein
MDIGGNMRNETVRQAGPLAPVCVDAEGRPVGIVDVSGIIHWLVDHFQKAVYNLPPVAKVGTLQREGP